MRWMTRGDKQASKERQKVAIAREGRTRAGSGSLCICMRLVRAFCSGLVCSEARSQGLRNTPTPLSILSVPDINVAILDNGCNRAAVCCSCNLDLPATPTHHRIRPDHIILFGPWQPASLLLILEISSPGDDPVSAYTSTGNGPRLSRSGEPHSPWR